MIKTKLTRGPFNVKGAGGIIIVKVLDHETFIGLPGTQQNCKNIFCQLSIFFSKNNLLLYGLVPEFTPEIPSALNQRVHDLFRFNLGISRQIQLQKVRTVRKYFSIGTKKNGQKMLFQVTRVTTGPEIRGCRPVLVAFINFKVFSSINQNKKLKTQSCQVSKKFSHREFE